MYSSPSSYIELVDIDLLQVLVLSDNESELSDSYLLNQYLNLCVDNLGMALGILRSVSRRYIVQSDSIQKLRDRWKVLQGICTDLHITEHTSSLNMAKIYLDQF